jgi:hypothetical protein
MNWPVTDHFFARNQQQQEIFLSSGDFFPTLRAQQPENFLNVEPTIRTFIQRHSNLDSTAIRHHADWQDQNLHPAASLQGCDTGHTVSTKTDAVTHACRTDFSRPCNDQAVSSHHSGSVGIFSIQTCAPTSKQL